MDITKHPKLYKKKALVDVKNRPAVNITDSEKYRIKTVLDKFFELVKNKHP